MGKYTDFWKKRIKEIISKVNGQAAEFELPVPELQQSIGSRDSTGYNGKLELFAGAVVHYKDSAVFRDLKAYIEESVAVRKELPGYFKVEINSNTILKVTYLPLTLEVIIERYKAIPEERKLMEVYKWRLIKKFQEEWNVYSSGATSFQEFFLNIDFRNLVYPIGAAVLKDAARERPADFEKILLALFDESIPLQQRVPDFVENFDNLYFQLEKHGKNSFLEERTIATLLTFRYPEKYTIYKDDFYSRGSKGLGLKPKPKGEKIFHYYTIIEELITALANHPEVINEKNNRLDESCYPDTNNLILAQDILYLVLTAKTEIEPSLEVSEQEVNYDQRKYWIIAPGEGAKKWDEFQEQGIIAIDWDKIDDLKQYLNTEQILNDLADLYPDVGANQTNNSLCLWEFANVINVGDIVIAKKGLREYLGYGIVEGEYEYLPDKPDFKHTRKISWKKTGSWPELAGSIVTKTLTDITKYPDYVDRLRKTIGIEQEASIDINKVAYYWLNANPKMWRIEDFQVGDEQFYTTHNDKGNKRNKQEHYDKIKPGDLVIGYETTPTRKVVAIFEVTSGKYIDEDDGVEKISFVIQKFLPIPITYEHLKRMPEMVNAEPLNSAQGTLFKLTKAEFEAIINQEENIEGIFKSYTKADALAEIFLDEEGINEILETLAYKKNIILQGAPGVGKTFMAKRLAYLMMGVKDQSRVEMIQFHQSYSYEDFIQGFRPKEDKSFRLENGVFYRICKRAAVDPNNDYFFIIDEINRGNLSKIFGELMLLIEADKRGEEHAVSLTYSTSNENKFSIPTNLYIIGTMNTADRSLAVVDYALRRRFGFINVKPCFGEKLKIHLRSIQVAEEMINRICDKIDNLNESISKDKDLGNGFRIGHSYFCMKGKSVLDENWYNGILKTEIKPLLEEYWFDNEEKCKRYLAELEL